MYLVYVFHYILCEMCWGGGEVILILILILRVELILYFYLVDFRV